MTKEGFDDNHRISLQYALFQSETKVAGIGTSSRTKWRSTRMASSIMLTVELMQKWVGCLSVLDSLFSPRAVRVNAVCSV